MHGIAGKVVRLRPFGESDLELMYQVATNPTFAGPLNWGGFRHAPDGLRRRWEADGFLTKDPHHLVVEEMGVDAVGFVMWRDPHLWGAGIWEIGVVLAPECRGRGLGTEAQALLVTYLFDTTPAHRICAFTELDNSAEQRALEKVGFLREGVLRQAGFRGGALRDGVVYGLLREDARPAVRREG